ncbi:hypothetical protein Bbelb_222900 [Branchiostoma belcheri]|nr:hypothetical protein Bbelb_222900 [Branchiostoma belcheri]
MAEPDMMVESSPGVAGPSLRGSSGPPPAWMSGCRGLFSVDGPLPRVFFPPRSGMADFDSVRMILAKCNLQSDWMKHVQPDGSLFYLEPESNPDPDRRKSGSETAKLYKSGQVPRRRDSGIEDDLVRGKLMNSNYVELQRFHVRLKIDPGGGGSLLDGVFPIEKLTRVDWLSGDSHCFRKRVFVEDLPEYGALTRLSNLRRGDCISALNDISVTHGNLYRLLAAVSQPMEVVLTIERSQRANLRMRNAVHQLDTVPESSCSESDEAHAQQNGPVFSSKLSNVDPRRQDGKAEVLIMQN